MSLLLSCDISNTLPHRHPHLFEEAVDFVLMGGWCHRLESMMYTIHLYGLQLCAYMLLLLPCRGLCGETYPDEVCRKNYTLHKHDPPLLFDLHSDPSEQYPLDPTEYAQLLTMIDKVRSH